MVFLLLAALPFCSSSVLLLLVVASVFVRWGAQDRVDKVHAEDEDDAEEAAQEDGSHGEEDVGHVGRHLIVLGDGLVHVAKEHRHLGRR